MNAAGRHAELLHAVANNPFMNPPLNLIKGVAIYLERLQKIVDEQAEDEGLWFDAQHAPESYLQQELRKLHAAIEGKP